MERMCNDPVCFVARLEKVRKYGLYPLEQLKKNPEAKLLFKEKLSRNNKERIYSERRKLS